MVNLGWADVGNAIRHSGPRLQDAVQHQRALFSKLFEAYLRSAGSWNGGFEDGGAVAVEVGLHPPQRRHPRLQPRELLLNLRHNPPLFGFRRLRELELPDELVMPAVAAIRQVTSRQQIREELGKPTFARSQEFDALSTNDEREVHELHAPRVIAKDDYR